MAEVNQSSANHQIYNTTYDRKVLKKQFKNGEITEKEYKKLDKELEKEIIDCQIDINEAFKLDDEEEETPVNNAREDDSLALEETQES